jgi:hypothetical protein
MPFPMKMPRKLHYLSDSNPNEMPKNIALNTDQLYRNIVHPIMTGF